MRDGPLGSFGTLPTVMLAILNQDGGSLIPTYHLDNHTRKSESVNHGL